MRVCKRMDSFLAVGDFNPHACNIDLFLSLANGINKVDSVNSDCADQVGQIVGCQSRVHCVDQAAVRIRMPYEMGPGRNRAVGCRSIR